MLDIKKEFTVGVYKELYILKFVATTGNICNFEQNSIHIFVVFFKREFCFL